jgi:hypothetical protein
LPRESNKYFTLSVCVCIHVLVIIQNRIILSSVACLALPYFFTLTHKRQDFLQKKVTEHKMCVLIFSTTFVLEWEMSVILRRVWLDIIVNVRGSSCKVGVILVRCWWNLNIRDRFSKIAQIWNFIQIRAVGAELFHTDGQTDTTKLLRRRLQFWERALIPGSNHRHRMTKERARLMYFEGVTHKNPHGSLWQHTCPYRQSEVLSHFFFWHKEDCGLAGVGQGDTSEIEMAFSYYDLYSVAFTLENYSNYAKRRLFDRQFTNN